MTDLGLIRNSSLSLIEKQTKSTLLKSKTPAITNDRLGEAGINECASETLSHI